jgi:hypothetical protein
VFQGKWRIVEIFTVKKSLIDPIEPEYIEFMKGNFGLLHFGSVYATIRYQRSTYRKVKFSFFGANENWEVFGRGFCQIQHEELRGLVMLKEGEWSEFTAKRVPPLYSLKRNRNNVERDCV